MSHSQREPTILRFATYLSPILYEVYESICKYVGEQTGYATQVKVGHSLDEFADGQAHVGFMCGLPYYLATRRDDPPAELLAAPVLYPKRYQEKLYYFSDIVVRRGGPITSLWTYETMSSLGKGSSLNERKSMIPQAKAHSHQSHSLKLLTDSSSTVEQYVK